LKECNAIGGGGGEEVYDNETSGFIKHIFLTSDLLHNIFEAGKTFCCLWRRLDRSEFLCLKITKCSAMAKFRETICEIWCFVKGVDLLKK
jgi:hypothetical protein